MAYLTSTSGDAALLDWKRARRRVLISGEPDAGKTTSLRTWDKPLHIISVPGELGNASLPVGDGIITHVFQPPAPGQPRAWGQDWKDTMDLCVDIANGKKGEVRSLAIDGIHKLYDVAMAVATNGVSMAVSGDFEARKYGNGWNLFKSFLDMVYGSSIENVVMTCWLDLEKNDPDDKSKDAARSLLPALPGKSAQRIMGEFSVRLIAFTEGVGAARKYAWATQPQGKMRGAGIKGPLDVVSKIPPRVPQDWQGMKPLLGL
jgi:hypothetical protein